MVDKTGRSFFKIILAAGVLIYTLAIFHLIQTANKMNADILASRWVYLLIPLVLTGLLGVLILILSFFGAFFETSAWKKIKKLDALSIRNRTLIFFLAFFYIAFLVLIESLIIHPYYGSFLHQTWMRMALWIWPVAFGVFLFRFWTSRLSWTAAFCLSILVLAGIHTLASLSPLVSDFPFSLGWSEASRYYDASLYFSQKIYGVELPLSVLHPSLNLLQAAPYLFGIPSILVLRIWKVFLIIALTLAVSLTFARRLGIKQKISFVLVVIWAFTFLIQTSIYFHLWVCVLLIFWGTSTKNNLQTLLVVVLASIWAGMSRLNWFPVPGLLAGLIYLFDTSYESSRRVVRYLSRPLIWVAAGTLAAFASQMAYIQLSGNGQVSTFYSSLSSTLLWYRLLPNPTYSPGILAGSVMYSLPFWAGILIALRQNRARIHLTRILAAFSVLAVLYVGGLIVSIKIGGGGDMHNLDAYFVALMLVCGLLVSGNYASDTTVPARFPQSWLYAGLAIMVVIGLISKPVAQLDSRDAAEPGAIISRIQESASRVEAQDGEVLFISQRQLLALGMVDARLVPEYELDFLMEMAMSNNRVYLDQFQADIDNKRFGMIVVQAPYLVIKGRNFSFGEENDIWVRQVASPLLSNYDIDFRSNDNLVAILFPKPGSGQ